MENDDIAENVGQNGQPKMQNKAHVRHVFQPYQRELEPYRKQPKITLLDYEIREIPCLLNTTQIEYNDFLGMISIGCHGRMWAGWNSLIITDPLPVQKVSYMENLNLPPTRLDGRNFETFTASSC